MARKRHKPEEIVTKLRQVEVLHGRGRTMVDAIRQIGVTEVTYYRWRKEYGGMSPEQLKRLKELEKENERLRRAVSDLTLDKLSLKEAARGNFRARLAVANASNGSAWRQASQNAGPVRCWAGIARRSAVRHGALRMKSGWPPT